jgi:hypothetical protein
MPKCYWPGGLEAASVKVRRSYHSRDDTDNHGNHLEAFLTLGF